MNKPDELATILNPPGEKPETVVKRLSKGRCLLAADVMENPANHTLKVNKRSLKDIVNEVIDEITSETQDEIVRISPDMNLGLYSPFQVA